MTDLQTQLRKLQNVMTIQESLKLRLNHRLRKSNAPKQGIKRCKTEQKQKTFSKSFMILKQSNSPYKFGRNNKCITNCSLKNKSKIDTKKIFFPKKQQKNTHIYCINPIQQSKLNKQRQKKQFKRIQTQPNKPESSILKKKKKCIDFNKKRESMAMKSTIDQLDCEQLYLTNKYAYDEVNIEEQGYDKKQIQNTPLQVIDAFKRKNIKIKQCFCFSINNTQPKVIQSAKQTSSQIGFIEKQQNNLSEKLFEESDGSNSGKINEQQLMKVSNRKEVGFKNVISFTNKSICSNIKDTEKKGEVSEQQQYGKEQQSKLILKRSLNQQTFKSLKTMNRIKSCKSLTTFNCLEGDRGELIGRGNYGRVWKVKLREQKMIIAVKKVNDLKGIREFQSMKAVSGHPFIVQVYDGFQNSKHSGYEMEIFMAYYADGDLQQKIIKQGTISFPKVKIYAYQILRGLHYIHTRKIIHRDIKSDNIFRHGNSLVIGDFGLSKFTNQGLKNCSYVCKRENRAPQLILGNNCYSQKIDIWAAGCVIVQMIIGRPLFTSTNSQDLLVEIIRVLGSMSFCDYEIVRGKSKRIPFSKLPCNVVGKKWSQILQQSQLEEGLQQLLSCMFQYCGKQRISAIQGLMLPYFDQIRNQQCFKHLQGRYNIQSQLLFFNEDEITEKERQKLVPKWFIHQAQQQLK